MFKEIGIIGNVVRQYVMGQVAEWHAIEELENEGVTRQEAFLITVIHDYQDENIYQRDIERILEVRRPTVTQLLNRMEAKGLIERCAVEHDRRLKKIVLTKSAEEHYDSIYPQIVKIEERLTECLTEQEIEQFMTISMKIRDHLER